VARWQLRRLGATASQIDGWVRRERMRPLFTGVYLVGPVMTEHAREIAAVLACRPGASLSHRSAAYLHGLLPYSADLAPVDITVTGGRGGNRPGIALHRTKALRGHEIRERRGIPLTAPLRTVIDLASCSTAIELERAVAEAFALGLMNRAQLLRAIDAAAGRRGVARLRTLVDGERQPRRTRSAPERRLLNAIVGAGLPAPLANHAVGGWEADLYWPGHGLVVEVDGYAAHSSPRAFERDRRKDADLRARGLTVQRFTARQVRDDLAATVAWIARELG